MLAAANAVANEPNGLARLAAGGSTAGAEARPGHVDSRRPLRPQLDVSHGMNDDMRAPTFQVLRSTMRGARANEALASPFLWADRTVDASASALVVTVSP